VLADEKEQQLHLEDSTAAVVETDRVIFHQVLINILDNAIKHSPRGGTIYVRVRPNGASRVAIEVEDSGPGIPAEHRKRVFDRFYRVDVSRSREDGGAGLGLSIARWGAEAHGGELQLECLSAKGCLFRIVLPTVKA
jgi:signal transduction histidine kinase